MVVREWQRAAFHSICYSRKEENVRNRLIVGLSALLLLRLALPVLAQNNTGIISGRVTDASGAVLQYAQISITHIETMVGSLSATNSDGLFRVPSLLNGAYKVTITAA